MIRYDFIIFDAVKKQQNVENSYMNIDVIIYTNIHWLEIKEPYNCMDNIFSKNNGTILFKIKRNGWLNKIRLLNIVIHHVYIDHLT